MEPYNTCLTAAPILLKGVSWSLCLVNKVWIEDIELISLHDLWRWVVMIIVGLVVFIPLITCVDTIEIFWLPWSVLVVPPIHLHPFYMKIIRLKRRSAGTVPKSHVIFSKVYNIKVETGRMTMKSYLRVQVHFSARAKYCIPFLHGTHCFHGLQLEIIF